MTSYVVITEEIDLMIEMESREERVKVGELMKAVPLETVIRETIKEMKRGGLA